MNVAEIEKAQKDLLAMPPEFPWTAILMNAVVAIFEVALQLAVMNEREAAKGVKCKCVWPMGGGLDSIIKTDCPIHGVQP